MARRCLTLLVSALLLAPASARADFTEAPSFAFTGEPSCLAPTGAPGEVAIGSSRGAHLLQATRTGFVAAGIIPAGEGFNCGSIVARPSGAAVIAGTQYYGDSVVAVVRDPGGAWSAPLPVATREGWTPQVVVGAVSERGDVAVAWLEERSRPEPAFRLRVAQRAPGQPFGAPKVVRTLASGLSSAQSVDVAVTAAGEALVSWTSLDGSGKGVPRVEANVATVAPDGTVGPVKTVELEPYGTASLSVAKDGRALLAYVRDGYVTFMERAPGAAFGEPVKLSRIGDPAGGVVLAQLHDTGAAAIAWSGNLLNRVRIATRPGLGGFRPPLTIAKGETLPEDYDPFWFSAAFTDLGGFFAFDTPFYFGRSLTLTADGRALLGMTTRTAETSVARLASLPLTGAAGARAAAGGEFDAPILAQPLELADGTPALTWITGVEENHLTLHLATEGGARPAGEATPRVRFGAPARRVLDYDDALRVPFSCSGPCSVRGSIAGQEGTAALATRYSAGKGELRIAPAARPIAAKGGERTLRVRVSYGAPGTVNPRTETVKIRVRRSSKAEPEVVGLRAVRRGGAVVVSFRVTNPPDYAVLFVSGSPDRDDRGKPLVVAPEMAEGGRRSYRVTLRPSDRVRYVTLRSFGDLVLPARMTVKVR